MSTPVGLAFQAGLWHKRISRARSLADGSPASAILTFYADLAEFQRGIAGSIDLHPADGRDLHATINRAAGVLPGLFAWLQDHAPSPLARAAVDGAGVAADEWIRLLTQRIESGCLDDDGPAGFVVEAVLQPFVEAQAVRPGTDVRLTAFARATYGARCPFCASAPVAAALREEGQGARRTLVCSLCFTEWDYLRIQCPACEENRFDALPVYIADVPANARIDACDSCRTYIKTIDLTKDGLAVPAVDDLASLPLDLWARERGYQRLYPNLLRL